MPELARDVATFSSTTDPRQFCIRICVVCEKNGNTEVRRPAITSVCPAGTSCTKIGTGPRYCEETSVLPVAPTIRMPLFTPNGV